MGFLKYIQIPKFWWGLAALFVALFGIASFPAPTKEAVPWLFLAAVCAAVACTPTGTFPWVFDFFVEYGWRNQTMRWHLTTAATFSTVLNLLTVGILGLVPTVIATIAHHPINFMAVISELNHTRMTGDNVWPYMILSAFLAPWAFPFAYGLLTHTPLARFSNSVRSLSYLSAIGVWWISQSVLLSLLFFNKNLFF
jgi:hypothetical protein